jgi:cyclopropane-fatty-acyl-phospholipid synthase
LASRAQIETTYNFFDEMFRRTFGETADMSCAWYDGDFSKTLAKAQQDKHEFVLDALAVIGGSRVLDIGCGWGPILSAARTRGADGVGLTLASKQAASCRGRGLDVRIMDWKDVTPDKLGRFDAVVSIGSFEHFCSLEEYREGKQDTIYDHFFQLRRDLLPARGRLYLQTAMWGKNLVRVKTIDVTAEPGSDERILAVLTKFWPGTWLPYGEEQLLRVSAPYFRPVSMNNGRLDYIKTMDEWAEVKSFSWAKLFASIKLLPQALTDPDFRYRIEEVRGAYQKEAFKRELVDHQRIVFEKT